MKAIRITTVDNYQGEENDIILLSLVRSNVRDEIGFLKVSNRVCVALSRARCGMYLFGNAKCLRNVARKKSAAGEAQEMIWEKVLKHLVEKNAINEKMTLKCSIHSKENVVKTVADWKNVP